MSGDLRDSLLNVAGRLKRRGLDHSVSSEEAFPTDLHTSSLDSLTDQSDYDIPITTDGSKTRVWLKVSDFSWVSGIIESGDERFEFNLF